MIRQAGKEAGSMERRRLGDIPKKYYAELSCCRPVGACRIELVGLLLSDTVSIGCEVKMKTGAYSSSSKIIVNSRPSNGVQVYTNSGRIYNHSAWFGVPANTVCFFETLTTATRRSLIYNGQTTYDSRTISISNGETVYLFSRPGDSLPTNETFYYIKLKVNGAVARDLVFARRLADNGIGMWDKISGVFYENVGSGYFEEVL